MTDSNPIDEAAREFAVMAVTTYLFLTKNGLKSDYVIEILHDSIDEIVKLVEEYKRQQETDEN